jgi:hypothetical protein
MRVKRHPVDSCFCQLKMGSSALCVISSTIVRFSETDAEHQNRKQRVSAIPDTRVPGPSRKLRKSPKTNPFDPRKWTHSCACVPYILTIENRTTPQPFSPHPLPGSLVACTAEFSTRRLWKQLPRTIAAAGRPRMRASMYSRLMISTIPSDLVLAHRRSVNVICATEKNRKTQTTVEVTSQQTG